MYNLHKISAKLTNYGYQNPVRYIKDDLLILMYMEEKVLMARKCHIFMRAHGKRLMTLSNQ